MPSLLNTTQRDLSHGGVTFAAGSLTNVSAHFSLTKKPFSDWIAEGLLVQDGTPAPEPENVVDERTLVLQGIIRGLDEDTDDNWTSNGRPQVDAINDALPSSMDTVTAAERDRVWGEMQ